MRRLAVVAVVGAAVAAAVVPALRHGSRRAPRPQVPGVPGDVVYATPANPPGTGTGETLVSFETGAVPPLPLLRVFRRAATATDTPPAGSTLATLAASMPNVPTGAVPDLSRARRLVATEGVALYAAPSRDRHTICVGLEPGEAWCSGAFVGGISAQVETSHDGIAGRAYGVADDSVTRIDLVLRNRSRLHALLARNGFYTRLPLRPPPREIVVAHRDGTRAVLRILTLPR